MMRPATRNIDARILQLLGRLVRSSARISGIVCVNSYLVGYEGWPRRFNLLQISRAVIRRFSRRVPIGSLWGIALNCAQHPKWKYGNAIIKQATDRRCPRNQDASLSESLRYLGTLVHMADESELLVERVQTGVRMEKRLIKVLKALPNITT